MLLALALLGTVTPQEPDRLELEPFEDPSGHLGVRGVYRVRENRELESGPWLELDLVVLLATGLEPEPDPIFVLHGGPGGAATTLWRGHVNSPLRDRRDIVFVDQRGTGGNHALRCPDTGTLDPGFDPAHFRACMAELSERYDLTQYTTPIAAHDLNEVREALGYDKINLTGGSYGTRMALVAMREHPQMVRTAVLDGVAPISFTNPLYHAASAQRTWDLIVEECRSTEARREAFGDLDAKLHAVLKRLEEEPAEVTLSDPASGEVITVTLTRQGFAEALRTLMYYMDGNRSVPDAVCRAYEGDYGIFVRRGLAVSRSIRRTIAMGMLFSVTCPEDVARIDPKLIEGLTSSTFLGDGRVRNQSAICEFWPKGDVGEAYGEEVSVAIPTLVLSGTHDPVTPPEFGEACARALPHSLHLTVPGCHGVARSGCLPEIVSAFLDAGTVRGLDTSCIDGMTMPPFAVSR